MDEEAVWQGPFSMIWPNKDKGDHQHCRNIGNGGSTLKQCQANCLQHKECNAVNYLEGHNGDCSLLVCKYNPSVSKPNLKHGGYHGYCVARSLQGKFDLS